MGETELQVADFPKLFAALGKDDLSAHVLKLSAEQRGELATVSKLAGPLAEELGGARKKRQEAEAARNKAGAALRTHEQAQAKLKKEKGGQDEIARATEQLSAARDAFTAAEISLKSLSERVNRLEKTYNDTLDGSRAALGTGARPFVRQAMEKALRSPTWWNDHHDALIKRYDAADGAARRARVDAARRKVAQLGIIGDGVKAKLVFRPARPGDAPAHERLSVFERAMVEEHNAVALCELVLPGLVTHVFHKNFVDARLTTPKSWRDIYRHDDAGRLLGWTRYQGGTVSEFTPEGWLVVKMDDKGRPVVAKTVVYKQDPPARRTWVNTEPLKEADGEVWITLDYEGGMRTIKNRGKAPGK
jgi:hypothetical protein